MATIKLIVTDQMDEIDANADNLTCSYDLNCDVVIEYDLNGKMTRHYIGTAEIVLRINVDDNMQSAIHDIYIKNDRFGGYGVDLDDSIDFGKIDIDELKSEYVSDCNASYCQ